MTREHSGSSTASTLRESLSRSAFATVEPGNTPKASDIWAALGGPRGLVESLLPGLSFLVVYSFTQSVGWSVAAPMTVAVGFIVARLIQRSPLQPAVIGFVGIAASAAVAVLSGRPENNFLLGLWVNAITLVILLASMALGRPLIGVVAGLLTADPQWRDDRAKTVMAMVATAIWSAMFGLRLTVQVPLYLAGESGVQALAMAKLVMGVPLYGATLWLTWLLLRSVYRGSSAPAS